MKESGIHDYTFKHYEQKKDIHAECGIKEEGSIIKIANVISAFIIFMAGFAFFVALFLFEICNQSSPNLKHKLSKDNRCLSRLSWIS